MIDNAGELRLPWFWDAPGEWGKASTGEPRRAPTFHCAMAGDLIGRPYILRYGGRHDMSPLRYSWIEMLVIVALSLSCPIGANLIGRERRGLRTSCAIRQAKAPI